MGIPAAAIFRRSDRPQPPEADRAQQFIVEIARSSGITDRKADMVDHFALSFFSLLT
nr:hypothetical protein [Sphingobium fuliginis]